MFVYHSRVSDHRVVCTIVHVHIETDMTQDAFSVILRAMTEEQTQ